MGTSRSAATPSGGGWTAVKGAITGHFTGHGTMSVRQMVGAAVAAGDGLGVGQGGTGRASGGVAAPAGRAVAGLAGFGASISSAGLDQGLDRLGLGSLVGQTGTVVVAAISRRLAEGCEGVDAEVLSSALSETLIEVSGLVADVAYETLAAGLDAFLAANGVPELLAVFLTHFVFNAVWVNIESYVQSRSPDEESFQAYMAAVETICGAEVRAELRDAESQGRLDAGDWFGADGIRTGQSLVRSIELRLQAMT